MAFPVCLENEYEITVAATDSNDKLAYFSNYGDVVDIAAPGVDIYSSIKRIYLSKSLDFSAAAINTDRR